MTSIMIRKLQILGACTTLLVVAGCGDSGKKDAGPATNQSSSPLTAPVDYLGAIQKGKVAAEKTVDVASITKAIQMFEVENGRKPKDLNELVQEQFLPRIPDAPYGMQIQYDPNTGNVKVVPKPATK